MFGFTKTTLVAALAVVHQGVYAVPGSNLFQDRAVCNSNNCARAVTGTAGAGPARTSMAKSDCSSYMAVTSTVTPGTVTNTVIITETAVSTIIATETQTITTYDVYDPAFRLKRGAEAIDTLAALDHEQATRIARRQTVKTIPAYASPCPNSSAYVSACSCFGVTAPTVYVTGPAPQATITSTKTESVLTTISTTVTATETTVPPTRTGKLEVVPEINGIRYLYAEPGYDHLIADTRGLGGDVYAIDSENRVQNTRLGNYLIYDTGFADPWFAATTDITDAITDFRIVDDGTGTRGRVYLVKNGVQQKWYSRPGNSHLFYGTTIGSPNYEIILSLVYI